MTENGEKLSRITLAWLRMVEAGLVGEDGEYNLISEYTMRQYRNGELVIDNLLIREYIEALIEEVGPISEKT